MRTFLTIALTLLLALPASAATAPTAPPALTAADHHDISRIETYLNNLHSITADFLQVDEQGGFLRGKISIQRPGKMRVTYDPPNKDFIICDGDTVHIWNEDLKSQTNVEQGSSLAEFILREPIKLEGDVSVTSFKRSPAKLEVTLVETQDPAAGSLMLVFEDNPMMLRQWKVLDPQGHLTGVTLENTREGITFPASTFVFTPPTFGKGGKAG